MREPEIALRGLNSPVSRRELAPLAAFSTVALAGLGMPAAGASNLRPARVPTEDRFGMLDLFAEYSWHYDCSDVNGYVSLFTKEGVIEAFGSEAARGREAISAFISKFFAERAGRIWQHYMDNLLFFGGGHTYTVYAYWNVLQSDAEKRDNGVMSLGYCVNECVKRGERWYYQKRSIYRWNPPPLPWAAIPEKSGPD